MACECSLQVFNPKWFKALSDPNRLLLLVKLANSKKPLKVGELSAVCNCDLSVVSRHLKILKDAGLIDAKKKGREVYYTVAFVDLIDGFRKVVSAFEMCCDKPQKKKGGRK